MLPQTSRHASDSRRDEHADPPSPGSSALHARESAPQRGEPAHSPTSFPAAPRAAAAGAPVASVTARGRLERLRTAGALRSPLRHAAERWGDVAHRVADRLRRLDRWNLVSRFGTLPVVLTLAVVLGLTLSWATMSLSPKAPPTAGISAVTSTQTGSGAGVVTGTPAGRVAEPVPGARPSDQSPLSGVARTGAEGETFDLTGTTFDVTVKLVGVLGLAYLALAALRRYSQGVALGTSVSTLKVVESTTLAPNRALYVVQVGEQRLLLGVTPTTITTLATLPEGASPASPTQPPLPLEDGGNPPLR